MSLDVTSTAQIQAAADQVESLDTLNNAGIALPDDLTDPLCSNATWPSTSSGPTP